MRGKKESERKSKFEFHFALKVTLQKSETESSVSCNWPDKRRKQNVCLPSNKKSHNRRSALKTCCTCIKILRSQKTIQKLIQRMR